MIQENTVKYVMAFSIYLKRGLEEGKRLYPEFLEMYLANQDKTIQEFIETIEG